MGEVQLIQDSLAQRDFIIEDLNNTLKLRNEELTRLSLEVWVLETGKKAMIEKIESLKKKSREEKLEMNRKIIGLKNRLQREWFEKTNLENYLVKKISMMQLPTEHQFTQTQHTPYSKHKNPQQCQTKKASSEDLGFSLHKDHPKFFHPHAQAETDGSADHPDKIEENGSTYYPDKMEEEGFSNQQDKMELNGLTVYSDYMIEIGSTNHRGKMAGVGNGSAAYPDKIKEKGPTDHLDQMKEKSPSGYPDKVEGNGSFNRTVGNSLTDQTDWTEENSCPPPSLNGPQYEGQVSNLSNDTHMVELQVFCPSERFWGKEGKNSGESNTTSFCKRKINWDSETEAATGKNNSDPCFHEQTIFNSYNLEADLTVKKDQSLVYKSTDISGKTVKKRKLDDEDFVNKFINPEDPRFSGEKNIDA